MLIKENNIELQPMALAGEPTGTASASEQQPAFKNAARVQESLTAQLERKLLRWLAEHMPPFINSDHLTLLGLLSMFLAGTCYALARWYQIGLVLATLWIAVNWFGDSLDGTLARVRNRQRPRYGFYVDHIIDAFGAFFLMSGLALSGYADPRIAIGMLVAFLLLSIELHLATYTLGIFQLSFWKFGPTEVRVLLAIGNTTLLFHPTVRVLGASYRLFDVGGLVAITGMAIMLVTATIGHTIKLYQEEKLP